MAILDGVSLKPPYSTPQADSTGLVTRPWQTFFRLITVLLDPLGSEQQFAIANNQSTKADISGMFADETKFSSAVVEYLIQRETTGAAGVSYAEAGILIFAYKYPNEWTLTALSANNPDDSGIDFFLKQVAKFTATYDHTTSKWTKSAHGLNDGNAVTLTAGTSLPAGYATNTTYYVINSALNDFKLSATKGGSVVVATTTDGTGTQTVYTSGGQVQYTSSNITAGTAAISKITYRARFLSAKRPQYSSL